MSVHGAKSGLLTENPSYEGSEALPVHRFKAGTSQPRTSFQNSAFKHRSIHLLQSKRSFQPRSRISVNLTAQVNMAGAKLVLAILPLLFIGAMCTNFNDTDIQDVKIGSATTSFNVLPVTHTEFDPMVKKVDDLYAMVLNLFQDMARMQIVVNNNNNNNNNNGANNQNNNNDNNNVNTRNTANNNNNGATAGR